MGVLYEKLNEIWFGKKEKPKSEEITIGDILRKKKAFVLSAKINGYDIQLNTSFFTFHWHGNYGRNKRTTMLKKHITILYKQVEIKNFFPKLTKDKLKKILLDFTEQNIQKIERANNRIELLWKRRARRLLPLDMEEYKRYGEKNVICKEVVGAVHQIAKDRYASRYCTENLSELTRETLWRLDEKIKTRPTDKERRYA